MTISYSLFTASDQAAHRELFRQVFGKALSAGLFAWKYRDNPHQRDDASHLIFVAKDGERLVGARSLFPGRVYFRDAWYDGAQGGDTMVHPDYRGRGIFTALLDYSCRELNNRGFNILYNFPNDNSLPGNLSQGARKVKRIVTAVKILSLGSARRRETRTRLLAPDLPSAVELPAPKGYALVLGSVALSQTDQLFSETFGGAKIVAQDRTSRQLNWRFASYPNPHKTYRFLHLWEQDRLLGYAVLALSGNGVGEVSDYLVLGHRPRYFRIVLTGALTWFRQQGASHAKIWCAHPAHRGSLARRAFLPKPLHIAFVTRFLEPVPFAQAPWYVTMGDTDTF